ncbi:TPA: GrpB family protein [Serratia marcescens]|nr:GrpB family protein [Serratia marcescens]HEJ7142854.1 GrpB family protein [Serratia marcescens]HEJ7223842.1 GrpB family protein [Serratia marcescens]
MDKVVLSEYNCCWRNKFLEESQKIKNAVNSTTIYIDHVGSTSVKGLSSKPIIDILISLCDWGEITKLADVLVRMGYDIDEKCDDTPRLFLKKYNEISSENYHVHICEPNSRWGRDMLVFKNELMTNTVFANQYVDLKKKLIKDHSGDIKSYMKGKKTLIENKLIEINSEFGVDRMLSYQRAESNKAENLQIYMMITQFIISLLAVISVYRSKGSELFWLAIIGFILIVAWFFLNQAQQRCRSAGDQARRVVLLMSGLKILPSAGQSLRINDSFNGKITSDTLRREEDHFATREKPGYKRLVEMIEESSYWTCFLQKTSAKLMLAILFFLATIIFVVTGAAILSLNTNELILFSRSMIALMIFIISTDVLGLLISYRNASSSIGNIFNRVEGISAKGFLKSDALLLMADYNSAIEKAPATLPFVYILCQKKLNKKWRAYSEIKLKGE